MYGLVDLDVLFKKMRWYFDRYVMFWCIDGDVIEEVVFLLFFKEFLEMGRLLLMDYRDGSLLGELREIYLV